MTDILHITDRERTQAAVILALESARDEMSARIPQWLPIETAPRDEAQIILANGSTVSVGGWVSDVDQGAEYEGQLGNAGWWAIEWPGPDAPKPTHWMPLPPPPADKPIWDQLAEIGASDPQAWDKP